MTASGEGGELEEGGFTLAEILIALACVGILSGGLFGAYLMSIRAHEEAARIERALVVAQDLYEEMLAAPFEGAPSDRQGYGVVTRPQRLGSLAGYDGLRDDPVTDILGRPVAWGDDLARTVRVRRFTPEDRSRVLPPLSPPTNEYAEGRIEVGSREDGRVLVAVRFVRAKVS